MLPSNVGAPTLNLEQLFADATGPQDRRRALERWIHGRAAAVLIGTVSHCHGALAVLELADP